ncbi:MAG: hypothetical protein ACYC3O_09865 [Burkholderiales bacterium]
MSERIHTNRDSIQASNYLLIINIFIAYGGHPIHEFVLSHWRPVALAKKRLSELAVHKITPSAPIHMMTLLATLA